MIRYQTLNTRRPIFPHGYETHCNLIGRELQRQTRVHSDTWRSLSRPAAVSSNSCCLNTLVPSFIFHFVHSGVWLSPPPISLLCSLVSVFREHQVNNLMSSSPQIGISRSPLSSPSPARCSHDSSTQERQQLLVAGV